MDFFNSFNNEVAAGVVWALLHLSHILMAHVLEPAIVTTEHHGHVSDGEVSDSLDPPLDRVLNFNLDRCVVCHVPHAALMWHQLPLVRALSLVRHAHPDVVELK